MIEFDDAGSGCPILGEVFVGRRIETNEMVKVFFAKDDLTNKVEKLFHALEALNPLDDEEIHLCRGEIFNSFNNHLISKGFKTKRVQIIGKTNDLAENFFFEKLSEVGVPCSIKLKKRNYKGYHSDILTWYFAFYEGRSLLKQRLKPYYRDYMIHSIYDCPNLLSKLFYGDRA